MWMIAQQQIFKLYYLRNKAEKQKPVITKITNILFIILE